MNKTLNCRTVSERKFSASLRFEIRAENGAFATTGSGPQRMTGPAATGERGVLSVSRRAWRGKNRPPGDHDLITGKKCFRKKKSYGRKSMLNLDQGKIGKGPRNDFVGKDWTPDPSFFGQ